MSRKRILIAEDQPLIAYDLAQVLEDRGFVPVGPCIDETSALAAVSRGIDGAIMNYILQGRRAALLLFELTARSIPYVIVTAHPDGLSVTIGPQAARHAKPAGADNVVATLESILTP